MSDADPTINTKLLHERRERVFLVLAGLFLGTLTMLNILGVSRFLVIATWGEVDGQTVFKWWEGLPDDYAWTFALAVGVLPYPITFLCTDLISEFYGRRRANFVVWVGLLLNVWVVLILWLGGIMPGFEPTGPDGELLRDAMGDVIGQAGESFQTNEHGQVIHDADTRVSAFFKIRALTFGAVFASMIAYLAAQFCDVYLFHFWKKITKGRHLWLRNNGSTMISQLVDSTAVILATHYWAPMALPAPPDGRSVASQLTLLIATGYAFKFVVALLDTIPLYLIVPVLSRYLQIDPVREHEAARV